MTLIGTRVAAVPGDPSLIIDSGGVVHGYIFGRRRRGYERIQVDHFSVVVNKSTCCPARPDGGLSYNLTARIDGVRNTAQPARRVQIVHRAIAVEKGMAGALFDICLSHHLTAVIDTVSGAERTSKSAQIMHRAVAV